MLAVPHTRVLADGNRILQTPPGELVAPRRLRPIGRIGQHNSAGQTGCKSLMYLFQRNIALGPKLDLCRHSSAFAPCSIARPVLRQIQLIPHRQTAVVIGDREADSDLAVVRLTQSPTVLACYANRVRAFLRIPRVIDDPVARRVFLDQRRQHLRRHRGQQSPIAPVGIRHQMMHRLVCRTNVLWLHARRHRLHALAPSGQHQTTQIPLRRNAPIRVRERLADHFSVLLKTSLQALTHRTPLAMTEDPGTIS